MMLTIKPVPITALSLPIAREDIADMIVVVRTKTGVELAGDLSNTDRCHLLLLDGIHRLITVVPNQPSAEESERG